MVRNKKEASRIQETRIADALGWSVVSGSGSRHLNPGDVISENWMGECKTHVNHGHRIKFDLDVWIKIQQEAKSRFKYPVLFSDDGTQNLSHTWAMFPSHSPVDVRIIDPEYPFKFNKHISFEHIVLKNRIINQSGDGRPILYTVTFGSSDVYIAEFRYFQQLFGE